MTASSSTTLAILNARLIDPASDYDGPGAVLVEDGRIVEVIRGTHAVAPAGIKVIDADGRCLAPGLIDGALKSNDLKARALFAG